MRTTNLLQTFYNSNPAIAQYNADKAKQNFDLNKELANRTFIKPLPSNGHLVRNNIFDMPAELFKDAKYNYNALKHSIKGKANDNELGSLNDLGMKVGGLAIATALYSLKQTPLTKVMEFVGLTTFFASMDIWPKIALQIPAKLIHGFDIRQQYRDNYGTKKPLFQDHQFIPWDLYTDQEINKIGDRLKVPKDIKNRRNFIQEKMRKIALQNNTLWMLTAGFATPIMSALICNSLERPINNYQDANIDKKAESLLENFAKEATKYDFSENTLELNKLLTENTQKPITPELIKNIQKMLTEGIDPITSASIEKDIKIMLSNDGFTFNEKSLNDFMNKLKKAFEVLDLSSEQIDEILPSQKELSQAFSDAGLHSDEAITDFSQHVKTFLDVTDKKINDFAAKSNNSEIAEDLQSVIDKFIRSNHRQEPEIFKSLTSNPVSRLTEELVQKIGKISEILNLFKARSTVTDKYAYLKAAQAPETVLANTWNNISNDMLKIFNFTDKEIKNVRHDRLLSGDLLREKLEQIVSNDNLYNSVVNAISEKLSYLENRTDFANIEKWNKEQSNKYKQCIDTTFNQAAEELDAVGMNKTAKRLVGFEEVDSRSLKDLKLSFMIDRAKGVKSSFYRILNTLDLYRRISKCENIEHALTNKVPLIDKEAIVEMCKQLLIKGHASDYAVKFYFPVSLEKIPNFATNEERDAYYGNITTKDGKVINKYFTQNIEELADNAYDKNFYETAMKLMYEGDLHPDTEKALKKSDSLFQNFMNYRRDIINFIGGDSHFAKKGHIVSNASGGGSSELRFLLQGATPDEIFNNLCSQKFNGNKWFKTFGLAAAVLLGITTISQFFMGKINYDKEVK